MPTIPDIVRTPKSFYVQERLTNHSDWRTSFHREYLQNSIDAGAKTIRIAIATAAGRGSFGRDIEIPEVVRVRVQDDGAGISFDTFRDVFFSQGATTKTAGSGAVGGFGTARTMLCYSNVSYRVRSGELVVEGDGTEYKLWSAADYLSELRERLLLERRGEARPDMLDAIGTEIQDLELFPTVTGTVFDIDIDPNQAGPSADAESMEAKLREVLDDASLRAKVFLNGDEVPPSLKVGQAKSQFTVLDDEDVETVAGTIHVRQGARARRQNSLVVRVAGLPMFTLGISAPAEVVVELDPATARNHLTASRDSLRGNARSALRDFVSRLERDASAALAPTVQRKFVTKGGRGAHRLSLAEAASGVTDLSIADLKKLPKEAFSSLAKHIREGSPAPDGVVSREELLAGLERAAEHGGEEILAAGDAVAIRVRDEIASYVRHHGLPSDIESRNADLNDIHIFSDEFENKKIRDTIRRWSPDYWVRLGDTRKAPQRGMAAHRFLTAWDTACRNAFKAVAAVDPELVGTHVKFATGFYFGSPKTSYRARMQALVRDSVRIERDGTTPVLMVNPINIDGSPAFDIDAELRVPGKDGAPTTLGMRDLEAEAVASVCHLFERMYDRDYAELLTSAMVMFDRARNREDFAKAEAVVMAAYGRGTTVIQEMDAPPQGAPDASGESRKRARGIRPAQQLMAHAAPGAVAVAGLMSEGGDRSAPTVATELGGVVTQGDGVTIVDCDRLQAVGSVVRKAVAEMEEPRATLPDAPAQSSAVAEVSPVTEEPVIDIDEFNDDLDLIAASLDAELVQPPAVPATIPVPATVIRQEEAIDAGELANALDELAENPELSALLGGSSSGFNDRPDTEQCAEGVEHGSAGLNPDDGRDELERSIDEALGDAFDLNAFGIGSP